MVMRHEADMADMSNCEERKRRIVTGDEDFVPNNFNIYNFYGTETCFCWSENRLVVFPCNNTSAGSTASLTILIAPALIRSIECFSERVFVVCSPCGVYKLSQSGEFFILSKTAIGIGRAYYEVLIPKNNCLYLDSKQDKSSTPLFELSASDKVDNLRFLTLSTENSSASLRRCLSDGAANHTEVDTDIAEKYNENLCVIVNGMKLLLLRDSCIKILYSSEHPILRVKPIMERERIGGLLLVLDGIQTLIGLHCDNQAQRIVHKKIQLEHEARTICAKFAGIFPADTLWIAYSNSCGTNLIETKLYCEGKASNRRISQSVFVSLEFYKQDAILGLTYNNELIEILTKHLGNPAIHQTDNFLRLESNMFKDTDNIINEICRRTKLLGTLNETWQMRRSGLESINLYLYQKKVHLSPRIFTDKLSHRPVLAVDFAAALPAKSHVIVSVKANGQKLFCVKTADLHRTRTEVEISEDKTASIDGIYMDLVTFRPKGGPWCMTKQFLQDPLEARTRRFSLHGNRTFLGAKLAALKRSIAEGRADIESLTLAKRVVRQEMYGA